MPLISMVLLQDMCACVRLWRLPRLSPESFRIRRPSGRRRLDRPPLAQNKRVPFGRGSGGGNFRQIGKKHWKPTSCDQKVLTVMESASTNTSTVSWCYRGKPQQVQSLTGLTYSLILSAQLASTTSAMPFRSFATPSFLLVRQP